VSEWFEQTLFHCFILLTRVSLDQFRSHIDHTRALESSERKKMATTAVTSDDSLFNILEFSSSDTSTSNVDMSVNVSTLSDGRVPGSPPRDRELSTIAFTPGRTTLNKESMLMLQVCVCE
jgi:hypothetical protein